MRAHVVDVDALERQLKDAEILCSPGTPLEYKQATYGFGIAWECISALRQQQEALKDRIQERDAEADGVTRLSAENKRLREAIEKAPHDFECPVIVTEELCTCWKSKALEPTKGSE